MNLIFLDYKIINMSILNKMNTGKFIFIFYLLIGSALSICLFSAYTKRQNKSIVTDYDGNVYNTIKIGKQIWMVENLKVTHYRNGDQIKHITDSEEWRFDTLGAYSDYNNNASMSATYGRLYNKRVVSDKRNVCPKGWRIPTKDDWKILEDYLGGRFVAGGKLKEKGTGHWEDPNALADNSSGFTALPAGFRFVTGKFSDIGFSAYLWSSGATIHGQGFFRLHSFTGMSFNNPDYHEASGYSIRCIKE
ncbi:MAG: hypothetical protein B7X86_07595 [Sphingobacteriales bacterium 17-39-43]|nr:MAG: hypothetical protein B7Y24_08030 [Sphingobacteriales bacterium 16-39-50]OZA24899.1 MAG: hypothetical protein B7X86_07595 [Sphingobacteriales bacterium 17-39-43]